MNNDDKINVYMTILAYTQGAWTPEEVEKSYEYLIDKVSFKKADLKVVDNGAEIH